MNRVPARPYARTHVKPRKQGRKLYPHPPCRIGAADSLPSRMGLLRTYRPIRVRHMRPSWRPGLARARLSGRAPAPPVWHTQQVRNGPFELSGVDRLRVDTGRIAENVVYFGTASFHERAGIPLSAT